MRTLIASAILLTASCTGTTSRSSPSGFEILCANAQIQEIERLLSADPSLSAATFDMDTIGLHWACAQGSVKCDLFARDADYWSNVLDYQPGRDYAAAVALLLRHGSDPNHRAKGGFTPVHVAAAFGTPEVLRLLIGAGGDPSIADDDGQSALDYAKIHGNAAVIAYLTADGPN
jgi:ankyrin repeat protein